MIILIDQETETVFVYTKTGLETLSFDDIDMIKDILGDEPAIYVTEGVESSADDIVNLVNSIKPIESNTSQLNFENHDDSEIYYLCSNYKGPLEIASLGINFQHAGDIKLIDEALAKSIEKSILIKQMIDKKQLSILSDKEAKKLISKIQKEKRIKEQIERKAEIEDDIIVNSDRKAIDIASDPLGDLTVNGKNIANRDIEVIDFTNEIK